MNKDIKTRDEMIFGNYIPERYGYGGGCTRSFRHMTPETARRLVEDDFMEKDEAQNYGPTVEKMLEFADQFPGVTFKGYTVSDQRDDYRVTLDAIELSTDDATAVAMFAQYFGNADEYDVYSENEYADGYKYHCRAWWD